MNIEQGDRFLQEEIDHWTTFMLGRLQNNVRSAGVIDSAEFLASLAATAAKEGVMRYRTQLAFVRHGRFADGGYGRGYHKGVYVGTAARGQRLKGRKGNKVYSRTAYGTLGTLMNNVANKYIELAPELLKSALTNDQN